MQSLVLMTRCSTVNTFLNLICFSFWLLTCCKVWKYFNINAGHIAKKNPNTKHCFFKGPFALCSLPQWLKYMGGSASCSRTLQQDSLWGRCHLTLSVYGTASFTTGQPPQWTQTCSSYAENPLELYIAPLRNEQCCTTLNILQRCSYIQCWLRFILVGTMLLSVFFPADHSTLSGLNLSAHAFSSLFFNPLISP